MLELIHMMEGSGGSNSLLTMLGQSITVTADPEKVQQLVDMGFERDRAEYLFFFKSLRKALVKYGNYVPRATEYLINQNPEEAKEEEPVPVPAPGAVTLRNLFAEIFKRGARADSDDEEPLEGPSSNTNQS